MTPRRRLRGVRAVVGVTAVAAVASCGLSPEAAPRDLPAEERDLGAVSSGSDNEAEGPDRIYLAAPGEERQIRSVPRDAVTRTDLFETLLAGPNDDEAEQQYSTFIPSALELRSPVRLQGSLLFLDVSDQLLELTGTSLTQALAQIVYTAAELDGVSRVQITVDGQTVSWARPNIEPTSGSLSIYDYPGFVQSAQPAFPALPAGA